MGTVATLMRPPGDPFHERLVAAFPQIQRFLPRLFDALEPVTTETVSCRRLISVPSDLRVGMKVHTLTATDHHPPAAAVPPRPLPVISRLRTADDDPGAGRLIPEHPPGHAHSHRDERRPPRKKFVRPAEHAELP